MVDLSISKEQAVRLNQQQSAMSPLPVLPPSYFSFLVLYLGTLGESEKRRSGGVWYS
jgi:hypothetical protein